jgi:hypothetical protein
MQAEMMKDAQGRLVPTENVREIDRLRDDLVKRLEARFAAVRAVCQEFRQFADGEIDAFLQLSQERFGIQRGGQCGNLSLSTYDGELRLQRAVQKRLEFSDEIHAAKTLIDECVRDWCTGARPELKVLVDDAFKVDQKGDLAADRVLGLRRLEIKDERWNRAMEAIAASVQVQSTRQYLRFYRRKPNGEYEHLPAGV